MDKIADLVGGVPPKLPPFREVNHKNNLIDPGKQIAYRLPKFPDALKAELAEKISWYTSTGWWGPTATQQAVPMLCTLKKSGKLCTVFNLHMQNDNMEKDVLPFPDQDAIWLDVTRTPYRSKLDVSKAYEQICIKVNNNLKLFVPQWGNHWFPKPENKLSCSFCRNSKTETTSMGFSSTKFGLD